MTGLAPYHQLTLDAPEAEALLIASALEGFGAPAPQSVSVRRMGRHAPWRIEAVFDEAPNGEALTVFLGDLAPGTVWTIAPLKEEDWVALSQSQLPPIRTRRFYVRGEHVPLPEDVGSRHVITIEAGLAFGTGHHASTKGCLLMLENLGVLGFKPRRILDLGAGTGLLAIASQRLWRWARILASDIDPVAVDVARANCCANHAPRIRHVIADGFKDARVRAGAPYDLVIANILAGPLKGLSRDIARRTRKGGRLILSGILDEQAASVTSAYRTAGFRLFARRDLEGWSVLMMSRN